jgi:hypothetical protein
LETLQVLKKPLLPSLKEKYLNSENYLLSQSSIWIVKPLLKNKFSEVIPAQFSWVIVLLDALDKKVPFGEC